MNRFIEGLKKFIVVVPFVLCISLFVSGDCLAQDKQQTQFPEAKKKAVEAVRKHYDSVNNQQKKLAELHQDTVSIAKNMRDENEKGYLIDLMGYIEIASLRLESPNNVLHLYSMLLFDCQPDVFMKSAVRGALDLKKQYDHDLSNVNLILSYTKNPTVVAQCNQAKAEIRNCVDILEKASELFK